MKQVNVVSSLAIALLFLGSTILFAGINDGLVAYYPFAGNANDETNVGATGTVVGATLTEDRFGNPNSAYDFDGLDDYIRIPAGFSVSIPNFTLSLWVMTRTIYNPNDPYSSDSRICFNTGDYSSISGGTSAIGIGTGKVSFGVKFANWHEGASSTSDTWFGIFDNSGVVANEYVHIVGVYSRGNKIQLWINGQLKNEQLIPDDDLYPGMSHYTTVGGVNYYESLYRNMWDGKIDEVRIYNRTLSPSEILELYEQNTSQNQAPSAPKLIEPINGSTSLNPNQVSLKWEQSTDPENDSIKYCITVKENGPGLNDKTVFAGCDNGIFDYKIPLDQKVYYDLPIPLKTGTTYWWAVWAKDAKDNWSPASEWRGFTTGGYSLADSDGDGIPDEWEIFGVDYNPLTKQLETCTTGSPQLNLPAMGADPNKKDIFIQVDYLKYFDIDGIKSYGPKDGVLERVVKAFALKGINIHIDAGPESIMKVNSFNEQTGDITYDKWGTLSKSTIFWETQLLGMDIPSNLLNIPQDIIVGSSIYTGRLSRQDPTWEDELFAEFNSKIKANGFSIERRGIFHYCFFGNRLSTNFTTSGVSHGKPGADLIVSLGRDPKTNTADNQAKTFMHELGHNLGLGHGGPVKLASKEQLDLPYKPNYLSVMNYSFQKWGLRKYYNGGWTDQNIDYSSFNLDDLNEEQLYEKVGLGTDFELQYFGTRYFYYDESSKTYKEAVENDVIAPIDWNMKNGENESNIRANIDYNPDVMDGVKGAAYSILKSYNDWDNLIFSGGGIGQLGVVYVNGSNTAPIKEEMPIEQLELIKPDYQLSIDGYREFFEPTDTCKVFLINIENTGLLVDNYSIEIASMKGWLNNVQKVQNVSLTPGQKHSLEIPICIPYNACSGSIDEVKVFIKSNSSPNITDNSKLVINAIDKTAPKITIGMQPSILWPPNHQMVLVSPIISKKDNCDLSPNVKLVKITKDDSNGSCTYISPYDDSNINSKNGKSIISNIVSKIKDIYQDTCGGDIFVDQSGKIFLRAERSGNSSDRIYKITYQATDKSQNSSTATTTVIVPHNK